MDKSVASQVKAAGEIMGMAAEYIEIHGWRPICAHEDEACGMSIIEAIQHAAETCGYSEESSLVYILIGLTAESTDKYCSCAGKDVIVANLRNVAEGVMSEAVKAGLTE